MAFLVISLSPWCPHCPRHPHIIPVIPTSSLCCPHHPHIVPIAPRRSPCGPHGCGFHCLRGLHPVLSPWSPSSPHGPRCPHIIPVILTSSPSSPHHPHSPQKVPMWSPWLWSPPHIVPIISTSSPHHLEGLHIIPNPQIPTSPTTHPPGGVGPGISKNAIRFELIEIF